MLTVLYHILSKFVCVGGSSQVNISHILFTFSHELDRKTHTVLMFDFSHSACYVFRNNLLFLYCSANCVTTINKIEYGHT